MNRTRTCDRRAAAVPGSDRSRLFAWRRWHGRLRRATDEMNILEVIKTINQMQAAGVLGGYAIGGAVGATFYLEPMATLDVDVFITLRPRPGEVILSLQPIFEYLKALGNTSEGEYSMIAGWPVQFLPTGTPLVEEGLQQAVDRVVDGAPVRVFTAEHLAAMALQTGRAKDKARLLQFIEAGVLDAKRFQEILARHGLINRWQQFEQQFLTAE